MVFDLALLLYADGVDAAYVDTREFNGVFTELLQIQIIFWMMIQKMEKSTEKSKPGDDIHLKIKNK